MAYDITNNVAESFVCQFAIKKDKYYIRNCNFACCFMLCEAWFLILRWEHWLRVFKNRVLRRTFGPRRVEVIWEWRLLHNEEPYIRYAPPNTVQVIKSRRITWAGHVAYGETGHCTQGFLVRPDERRPLGRPGNGWEVILKLLKWTFKM